MPSVTLHHKTVANLERPRKGRTRYWDDTLAGFHVLATPTERIYKARFQRPNGTKIDYRIGRVEDWSLSDAREKADKVIKEAKKAEPGDDPQFKKLKAKSKDETFGVLAAACLESLSLRPSTAKNWGGIVKNYLVPRFGTMNTGEIDRRMIRDFTEKLGKTKPVQAARAFEVLRRIFSWGVETERLRGTPFVNLKKPEKVMAADSHERERTLSRAELHRIFQVLRDPRFTVGGFDVYIRLLFETAVRRDEMLKAAWTEVDLAAGFFTVGQLRYKSKRPHQVPLTKAAAAALRLLKDRVREKAALADAKERLNGASGAARDVLEARCVVLEKRLKECTASDFVFPGPKAAKPRVSPQRAFEALRRQAGFEDWTLHDIRRTVATELDRLGIAPQIREAVLGHAPDKLSRTYSRHVPLLEMRRALERWSAKLDEIIKTAPSIHPIEGTEAPRRLDQTLVAG